MKQYLLQLAAASFLHLGLVARRGKGGVRGGGLPREDQGGGQQNAEPTAVYHDVQLLYILQLHPSVAHGDKNKCQNRL